MRGANKSSYISKARTIKIPLKIKIFKLALIKSLIYIYKSVRVVLAVAPTNQKYPSAVSLEISRFSHPVGTIRVSRGRDSCCWWTFFPLSIHSSPMKIIALPFLLLVFKFKFFLFLIFFLCVFLETLLIFNFIILSKFMVLFFSIWSSLFWFLIFP